MDIGEQIEASFGDGPDHRPLESRLSAGRRARRRRKGAEGVAAVAGVVVLGLAAYAITPGGTPDTAQDPGFAGDPSGSPTDDSGWTEVDPDGDPDGDAVLGNGVTKWRQIPNPLDRPLPNTPVRVEVERNGEWVWMQLEYRPGLMTIHQWLDSQPALPDGGRQLPFAKLGAGEVLNPLPGVRIVQQRPSPDVGGRFAAPADRSAVAEVLVDGQTWFVLARQVGDGAAEYFPTAAVAGRETLAEFLAYVRGQGVGGEGLR